MTTEQRESATAVAGQNMAGKYLPFALGGESYAIPVLKVREIIRLTSITTVPQMPDYNPNQRHPFPPTAPDN